MSWAQTPQVALAAGSITGNVFQDFNNNGVKDTSGANNTAVDRGVQGVTVSAYDAGGVQRGTATTDGNGNYTLTATGSGPYRIEFTTLPATFEPTTHGPGASDNGSSVQFVPDGNTANVNFAINVPCEYCQNNARLAEAMHKVDYSGVAQTSTTPQTVAIINNGVDHTQPNYTPAFNGVTFQSNVTQTGGLWGIAWDRTRRSLYVSSVFRRVSDVGPLGLGGIYSVDPSAAAQNATPFVTIANVGDPRLTGHPDLSDTVAIANVGKVGLGGMDMSDDDSKLYVMNLNTRRLVQVDVASKTEAASYAVNNPGCANANDVRPWAVKVYRAEVYIGVTCSGETNATLNGQNAYVMKLSGNTFTTLTSMPLVYAKDGVYGPSDPCGNRWNPWTNTVTQLACATDGAKVRPEPLLSSIEFDADGSLIVSFLDRFVFKTNPKALIGLYEVPKSSGDIRRFCNVNGVLVTEGSAGCAFHDADEYYIGDSYIPPNWYGNINYILHQEIATGGLALMPGASDVAVSAYDPANNDWDKGPNGRSAETNGVMWLSNSSGAKTRAAYTVGEQTGTFGKGGAAGDMDYLCDPAPIEIGNRVWLDVNNNGIQDPGEGPVVGAIVTLQTPTTTLTTLTDANGLYYFSNLRPNTAYTLSITPGQAVLQGSSLAKTNNDGISSNTPISDVRDSDATLIGGTPTIYYTTGPAGQSNHSLDFGFYQPVILPAGLGDYVWIDTSHDGVQNENTPLQDVLVTLYDVNNNPISTTTTNASGFYSFTNLVPGTYSVGFTLPQGYTWTVQGGNPADGTDSNVNANGRTQPVTLASGEFNPTIDAGVFLPGPAIALKKYTNGQDADAAPGPTIYAGQTVTWTYVMTNTGNVVLVNVALTDDKEGPITCPKTELAVGESMICTKTGIAKVGQYANTATVTGANKDNPSQTVTSNDPSHYNGLPLASLGNYVWIDTNRDGQQGNPVAEPPLAGVLVTLYDINGNVVATTTTDASGLYAFTNLIPGTYSVGFALPPGYAITQQGTNPTSDTDSNANPVTGRTEPVVLGSGENNPTIDLGVYLQAGAISLKKYTNGQDADTAPGVNVLLGSTVTWTYVVKNIGTVPLTNVVVTDNIEGAITCPKKTLAVGETMTCTKTGIAKLGQYANVGTVTGVDAANPGTTLTSSDPSHYFAGAPQLVIRKRSIPVDISPNGQQTIVAVGDRITYTLQVTNTGNISATSVRISDAIPTGTQFVSGSAVPTQASGPSPLVWNVGLLAPSQSTSVQFSVIVVNLDAKAVRNFGTVQSNETPITNSNILVHVLKTTAVELIDFTAARGQDASVRVQWTTGAELNTFGFAVYRSATGNRSDATPVSTAMIAARGGNNRYEFVDTTAQAGQAYAYWLMEVETTGATIEYGPAKLNAPAAVTTQADAVAQVSINGAPAGGVVALPATTNEAVKVVQASSAVAAQSNSVAQGVNTVQAQNVSALAQPVAANEKVEKVLTVEAAPQTQPTGGEVNTSATKVEPQTQTQASAPEASTSSTTSMASTVSTDAKPVAQEFANPVEQVAPQRTVAVVAQVQPAPRSVAHAVGNPAASKLAQAITLAAVLSGVVVLLAGLGFGVFMFARRKRE